VNGPLPSSGPRNGVYRANLGPNQEIGSGDWRFGQGAEVGGGGSLFVCLAHDSKRDMGVTSDQDS
jgi:hypothetical protein